MYFIVWRYVKNDYLEAIVNGDGEDTYLSQSMATWPTEAEAEQWIANNRLCQSGQVVAQVYEAP